MKKKKKKSMTIIINDEGLLYVISHEPSCARIFGIHKLSVAMQRQCS